MRLIGTIQNNTLLVRGLPIPLEGGIEGLNGQRVSVQGLPMWDTGGGSYFKVSCCVPTKQPDQNDVEVEGRIVAIYPERKNPRNRRSACVLIQQNSDPSSTVLVTALSSNVDLIQTDNLSIGMWIRVGGYISFHGKGLHVLYMKTIAKEGDPDAGA